MTDLKTYLIQLIAVQGPLPLAAFMAEALGNKTHGYYMKQDPFGESGDFTTAPEISQMFGEMIGLWQAGNWLNMDSPAEIHVIELGPGRGTLMQDALRSMKIVPGLDDALTVHLVEMSPVLRDRQREALAGQHDVHWHNRIGEALTMAGGAPILLIANEFFDALPIRQFERTESGWHERLVCLDEAGALALRLAPAPSPEMLIPAALHRADIGSVAEICPSGDHILAEIAEYIKAHGGAGLIIDYGHDRHGTGDTLQAVRRHKYVDILADPGNVDLTAHVNFQRLQEVAVENALRVYGPVGQGAFLKAIGIETRAQNLLNIATKKQQKDVIAALHRLTDDAEMGALFKVMAIGSPALSGVIGFEGPAP